MENETIISGAIAELEMLDNYMHILSLDKDGIGRTSLRAVISNLTSIISNDNAKLNETERKEESN